MNSIGTFRIHYNNTTTWSECKEISLKHCNKHTFGTVRYFVRTVFLSFIYQISIHLGGYQLSENTNSMLIILLLICLLRRRLRRCNTGGCGDELLLSLIPGGKFRIISSFRHNQYTVLASALSYQQAMPQTVFVNEAKIFIVLYIPSINC